MNLTIELERPFRQFELNTFTIIAGPSASGKTSLIMHMIMRPEDYFYTAPSEVYIFYKENQAIFNEAKKVLESKGIQVKLLSEEFTQKLYDSFTDGKPRLLIFDDCQKDIRKNALLENLSIQGVHHRNLGVICILQNYYFGSNQQAMNLKRSVSQLILMKNPQDARTIRLIGAQMFPFHVEDFVRAYFDATKEKFGALLIDCTPSCPEILRIRGDILNKDYPCIYVLESLKKSQLS